ncbi:hypothetical protein OCF84_20905 (plasmid) [Shewanella xiamenensis]|uniref:Uncharacterized protein n=1 Tax=Shewanella xiamenensis TaxID=332186 RepID=A0ABT6UFM0_9GAMM|nr:hypothetical protein [Shewanella xiamenensis]MDI5833271.1 hypothetical protein [Shewanella xiamenensis]WHF57979.1 hypothetical protein OCF84_20905 [Shewanella xiamenensis]
MYLTLIPTKLKGGVTIKGDASTIRKVERLLARTAIESHACDDDGLCMTLSRYFEKNGCTVDWITLIAGVAALRGSLGYRLNKENHALMCVLEFEVCEVLCKTMDHLDRSLIEQVLNSLHNLNDRIGGEKVESRMVYLYLLKTAEARQAELLKIIKSVSPSYQNLDSDYVKRFEGLRREHLSYKAGTEFEYTL